MQSIILKSHPHQMPLLACLITILEAIASVQYEEIVDEMDVTWLSFDFQLQLPGSMLDIV